MTSSPPRAAIRCMPCAIPKSSTAAPASETCRAKAREASDAGNGGPASGGPAGSADVVASATGAATGTDCAGLGPGIAQLGAAAAWADNGVIRANRMSDRMVCPFSRAPTLGQFPANGIRRPRAPFAAPAPTVAADRAVTHATPAVSRCGYRQRASRRGVPRVDGHGADIDHAERAARPGSAVRARAGRSTDHRQSPYPQPVSGGDWPIGSRRRGGWEDRDVETVGEYKDQAPFGVPDRASCEISYPVP